MKENIICDYYDSNLIIIFILSLYSFCTLLIISLASLLLCSLDDIVTFDLFIETCVEREIRSKKAC